MQFTLPILELCSCHPPPGKVQRSKRPTNAVWVPSLPNLPPCNLRPTTTCQPQTTERPPVYLSDPTAVYYLEPHPLRHTRAFHFGLLLCVFPTFFLILCLCAFPPEKKAATRPAPRLALSCPRDRTRHLALGNLLEHNRPAALTPTGDIHTVVVFAPVCILGPLFSPPPPPPGPSCRRPDSISMAHLRLS